MIIGSHVNFCQEELYGCVKMALSFKANAFMFYTGAPQNTIRRKISKDLTNKAHQLMRENGIDINNVICHAPYIINLANKENITTWRFSIDFMKQELKRVASLGIKYIVVHPGNYLKQDLRVALLNISEAINKILETDDKVVILLETMAGKGTECGKNISELKTIYDNIIKKEQIGICLDTCHLNDSGVDIANFANYLNIFDQNIGINKIKCIHLNDSKNVVGSQKDRHANIGYGTIGFTNLINVAYNPKLKDVPKILETPWLEEYPPYKFEIAMLKDKKFNPNLKEDVLKFYNEEKYF